MPPPDLDYAAEWCAESDFGTYSASALCCVLCKRSCVGGWNVPVSHLWKGLIFYLPGK